MQYLSVPSFIVMYPFRLSSLPPSSTFKNPCDYTLRPGSAGSSPFFKVRWLAVWISPNLNSPTTCNLTYRFWAWRCGYIGEGIILPTTAPPPRPWCLPGIPYPESTSFSKFLRSNSLLDILSFDYPVFPYDFLNARVILSRKILENRIVLYSLSSLTKCKKNCMYKKFAKLLIW